MKKTENRIQKRILGQIRRAVDDYNMIEENDRIAIGVSGGKDSLTLLVALKVLQRFYPKKFELEAVTLTLGIDNTDFSKVEKLCKDLGINYIIEETIIGKIVFEAMTDENPCSLCANLRRGALHNVAKKLGCNKVALGHNRNDVIETLLLSMFYEGRIHVFSPVTYLSRKDIFVIRPLIYSEEADIRGFIKSRNIETVKNPCPVNGLTKRNFIKEQLKVLQKNIPMVQENIFGAIKRSGINNWSPGTNPE